MTKNVTDRNANSNHPSFSLSSSCTLSAFFPSSFYSLIHSSRYYRTALLPSSLSSPLSFSSSRSPCENENEERIILADVDWDELVNDAKNGLSLQKTMFAGASAGVMEHVFMFPVDTIKTRVQMEQADSRKYKHVFKSAYRVYKQEGIKRLYSGVTAAVGGAIPAHAVHFATYEFCKRLFGTNRGGHHPVLNGMAGGFAVMAHDFISTPLDVVKQRLQQEKRRVSGLFHCIRQINKQEGPRAFYASYPTTVVMNVPFMAVYFASYESFKIFFSNSQGDKGPLRDSICGGLAGAMAGFVSTPLDVLKTRLQTQERCRGERRIGPMEIARDILKKEGMAGFLKGARARVYYFIPSAAVCWTTYEGVKRALATPMKQEK